MSKYRFIILHVIAVTLLALLPDCARAEETGNSLYLACSQGEGAGQEALVNELHCVYYLQGFVEAAVSLVPFYQNIPFCPGHYSKGGTTMQIKLVFLDWARRNPQYLGRAAGDTVIAALSDAFPCPSHRR
jgi:hypothetical protein